MLNLLLPWIGLAALLLGVPAAAAAATAAVTGAAKVPEVITVGVFTVAPYVVAGPDGPSGALVEFFDREIAPRMGVRFRWERPTTIARLEQNLISGRVMFTPIMLRNRQREKAGIRFAGDVYVRFNPCLAVMPDSPLQAVQSPADLAAVRVGWVQAGALPDFMLDRRIRLDRIGSVEWTPANMEKLRLGRIGAAYFSNHYTPQYFAARSGMKVRLISLPTRGLNLYGAFGKGVPTDLLVRFHRAADEAFAGERFNQYVDRALAVPLAQR